MMIGENMVVLAMTLLALDWVSHSFMNEPPPTMAYCTIYIKHFQTVPLFQLFGSP